MDSKITAGQQVAFAFLLNLCANVWVMPGASINGGGKSFWVPILISGLNTVAATYLVLGLSRKFPGLTGVEMAQKILGRYLGWAFGLLWALFLAVGSGADARVATEQVWERYFTFTPVWAVVVLSMIGVVILALGGPLRMTRMAPLMAAYVAIGYLILLAFASRQVNLGYLLPLTDLSELNPASINFWVTALPSRVIYIVPMFVPFFSQPDKLISRFKLGLLIGIAALLIASAVPIVFFGSDGARALSTPYASALAIVTVYNFPFERLELFPRYFHLMASLFTVAALLYSSGLALCQLFGSKTPAWWVGGVSVFGALLASSTPENEVFEEYVMVMLLLAPLFLTGFALMWVVYYARGMHRQPPPPAEPQDEAVKAGFK